MNKLVLEIYTDQIYQWHKANALFKPLNINEKIAIISKIKELWNQAVKFSFEKGKGDANEQLITKLDKLFDILYCKC